MADRLMLDANVVIDLLRGRPEAVAFVRSLMARPLLSAVVVGELYAGVRDGIERDHLDRLVAAFRVVPIDRDIAMQGGLFVKQYAPSHGTGLADALIAASSLRAGARLVTLNTRHFPMLPDVHRPY